jgi:hypothetical protein
MDPRSFRYRATVPIWLCCFALPALAADVPCGIGTHVEGEMGTGAVAEIGSEPPHVGWVRITHSWSPKGEWYDWRIWDVHPAGSADRCVAPGASAPQPAGEPATFGIQTRDDDDPPARQSAPARAPAQRSGGGGALEAGNYSCSLGAAGTFPIAIAGDGTYRDRAGESGDWSYDAASGAITFSSGSLEGTYSKKLGPGKFGLSSAPTKQFHAVCNLK